MANNSNNNIHGYIAPGWENVRSTFEQNLVDGLDIGASLCVYHQGECVVDLCGGWKDAQMNKEQYTSDTLQLVFSVSKGVMAAAIALCVERGWLDYEAPVAQYWPEFAANGKQVGNAGKSIFFSLILNVDYFSRRKNITVGELLSHRAGLPCVDEQLTLDDVCNWSRMTSLLAAQKPYWEPGTTHGYHAVTLGFLGGELIRRVDPRHRSCGQFIRDELDSEFYVGVPSDDIEARVAPLIRKVRIQVR
jgi:CubicO group peptidase (beta-lactamase class C family)